VQSAPAERAAARDRHRETDSSARGDLSISESTAERYTLADPDVRLMLRVRDDDAAAFEELMLRYQHRVVSLLAHMTSQPDIAEDLAQDVFMRVYRARKRYVPGAKFSTWLFTITGNVAANALRSRARRHEVRLPASSNDTTTMPIEAIALAASGLMPTRQLDKAELREAVREAIQALGDRQRMAVLLSKFEHFSYAEIAEIMDLSPEAVKSLLSRARCRLRDVLEPYISRGSRVDSREPELSDSGPRHSTLEP
jgi:RNA polymerase sigma-70 factor (ECF subfamily)